MLLFDQETRQPMSSGRIVTIATSDPVALPMPLFVLLDRQWHLARIAATKGADEVEESDVDSDENLLPVP